MPGAVEAYARFPAPVEAWAVHDDDYAPVSGVRAYVDALANARCVPVSPVEVGLTQLGHFGPFRPAARALWDRLIDTLDEDREQREAG